MDLQEINEFIEWEEKRLENYYKNKEKDDHSKNIFKASFGEAYSRYNQINSQKQQSSDESDSAIPNKYLEAGKYKQIFDKVRTLIASRKLDEATEEMQRYLMGDPSNADAHYLMGTVYLQKGQVLSAFEHLQEAVKRNPDHLEAHRTLGQLYLI